MLTAAPISASAPRIPARSPQPRRLRCKPTGKSWVSRAKPNEKHGDWLIVAGEGEKLTDAEATLNEAALDLVLRYWVYAKDSGTRRVPLVDTPIEKGSDPKLLP